MRGDAREKTQNMGKRASIAGKGAGKTHDQPFMADAFDEVGFAGRAATGQRPPFIDCGWDANADGSIDAFVRYPAV